MVRAVSTYFIHLVVRVGFGYQSEDNCGNNIIISFPDGFTIIGLAVRV